MADITQEIEAFLNAKYGEQVRSAMVSAMNKINTVNEEATTANLAIVESQIQIDEEPTQYTKLKLETTGTDIEVLTAEELNEAMADTDIQSEMEGIRIPAEGFDPDTPYTNAGQAVRGQVTALNAKIEDIEDDVDSLSAEVVDGIDEINDNLLATEITSVDYSTATAWDIGSIRVADGTVNTGSSNRMHTVDYIPDTVTTVTVTSGYVYLYAWEGATYKGAWNGETFVNASAGYFNSLDISAFKIAYPTYKYKLMWLLTNHNPVPSTDYTNIQIIAPADTVEAEVVTYKNKINNCTSQLTVIENIINKGANDIQNYFVGTCVNKKEIVLASNDPVLFFGDSITHGSAGVTPWPSVFATLTDTTANNKAVSGALFGHSAEERPSQYWISTQISGVTAEEWSSAKLIIISAGTNDVGYDIPIAETAQYVQDAITTIRSNAPDVPIVFITPIRRGLQNSDTNLKLPEVSGVICNIALQNNCNVICGFNFPIPTTNIGSDIDNFTLDGLHPNQYGANTYAKCVITALF